MLWSGVPNTSWILETWSNSLVPGNNGFKLKHKGEQQSYCGSTAMHRALVGHVKHCGGRWDCSNTKESTWMQALFTSRFYMWFSIESYPKLQQMKMPCPFCVEVPHDLKEDTTSTPHVHLKAVVPISEEALWGSVPACGDVFCMWRLGVHTPTWTKVAKLQTILLQFSWKKNVGDSEPNCHCCIICDLSKLGQRCISLLWECFLASHLCEKSHSCRERGMLGGGGQCQHTSCVYFAISC